ncbi:MAG TPA: ABC transporter ATP-binding protein [Chitinophagales bacterium]|nr:ABC transporter ATP-binding protein [Chitinophagales bacterium]
MESIIKVENLSKRYRIGRKQIAHDSLGGKVFSWLKSPFSNLSKLKQLSSFEASDNGDIIWALKNVSFDVKRGEVMGIIGKNGAGKSTLLKILSRITEPTEGKFVINGRVASLLEVGTGFHQELTGRENIYMNGTILGMKRREISKHFDEIVAFSGVEKFIDTPIKRYSSGMKVRLAFAVAAYLEPEILIIDEVLAVGDAEFQKKCMGKMKDISGHGKTILFVSHNMSAVHELCTTCALIQGGKMVLKATPPETIKYYLDATQITGEHANADLASLQRDQPEYGRKVSIESFRLKSTSFYWREPVEFDFSVRVLDKSLSEIEFGFGIDGSSGARICTYESEKAYDVSRSERLTFHVKLDEPKFVPATYYITLGLRSGIVPLDVIENVAKFDVLDVDKNGTHFGFTQGVMTSGYIDTRAEVEVRR